MFTTDERKDVKCEIMVYDVRADDNAIARITVDGAKITTGLWGPFDEYIITGHEDGSLTQYDHRVSKGNCLVHSFEYIAKLIYSILFVWLYFSVFIICFCFPR